jgi:diguanylate cyclase (GGDEF)-like protein
MSAWSTPYAWVPVLLLLAAAPTAWLGLAVWRRRRVPGATPLALTALLVAVWCALAAVESTSRNQPVQLFLSNLEYISQACLPVLWLLVVLEFTGRDSRLRRALPWLFVVPAVTVALVFTNRWHGLLLPPGDVPALDFAARLAQYGPWYWVQTLYSYLLLAASLLLLGLSWLRAAPPYRAQLSTLLACMLVPLAWIGLSAFQQATSAPFAAAPVVLALSTLIVVWGLFSFHLFDVRPLAQAAVLAGLSEAVVVIDANQRIADCNPAAVELFGWADRGGRGQPAAEALGAWPELAGALGGGGLPAELAKGLGAGRRVYELSLAPLADPHGRPVGQVLMVRDATQHRRIEDELARLSTTDDVTGLADRDRLFEALGDELRRARRYDAPLALLLLDLDHFKGLNDQFGRQAGDEALRAVARAMQRLARQSDLPARQGGDEFMLVLPNTNLLGAETVAGRLVAAVNQIQAPAGAGLSLSVGAVELAPGDDEQGEALLARAEIALRAAQAAGGGRVMVQEAARV